MENKTQTPDKNIPTKSGMYHQMNGFQKFLMMCSGSNIHILQKLNHHMLLNFLQRYNHLLFL